MSGQNSRAVNRFGEQERKRILPHDADVGPVEPDARSNRDRRLSLALWFGPSSIVLASAIYSLATGEFAERWFGFFLLFIAAFALSAVLVGLVFLVLKRR